MNYNFGWLSVLTAVTITSWVSRFYKLDEPEYVCWDETHFGKMASYYINRTFFFDVHPPLGKMLIGLSGHLTGYDGSTPFEKPGDAYTDTSYIQMRTFCAVLGSALAPLSFLIVVELTESISAGVMASSFLVFDTGCLTLSQYILLDPILLFFIMLSTFCLVMFHKQSSRPFQLSWWLWMSATGVVLACAISVKFVGLFIILLTGIATIQELWRLVGIPTITKMTLFYHLLSRIACLIVLPVLVYLLIFAVHFAVLTQSGKSDAYFSSHFQSSLHGNTLYNAFLPKEVAYGSVITLRNSKTGGGLLHSHQHLYPEGYGPKQRQVTTYSYKDSNNLWLVKRVDVELDPTRPVQFVTDGDYVRLEHLPTSSNLHSHKEPAPLTTEHFQVSSYGINGVGDTNDIWRVEIPNQKTGSRIHTVFTQIKLVHYNIECALSTSGKLLPKWGFEQQEVTCNPDMRDARILWNIEDHSNARLPNISFEVLAPSFLEKVIESHVVMLQSNSDLKPKAGEITSRPWQWILNYRGQWFFKGQTSNNIYLLGNPVIFLLNLLGLVVFLVLWTIRAFMKKRGHQQFMYNNALNESYMSVCAFLFVGWLVHYAPFFVMSRVLYFHHYFPAMLFNSMLTGVLLDFIFKNLALKLMLLHNTPEIYMTVYTSGAVVVIAIIVPSFYVFHPLSYGLSNASSNSTSNMPGLFWMKPLEL